MGDFERSYDKMKKAYDKKKYEKALQLLSRMWEENGIPAQKEWMCHNAAGLSYFFLGDMKRSLPHLKAAWENPGDADPATLRRIYSNYLMYLHYLPAVTDEELAKAHFHYADFFSDVTRYTHRKREKEKLRIGYISPDIVDHVVLNFSIQLFACYDRKRYEVILYSTGKRTNEVTDWVASMVDGFRDFSGLPAEDVAKRIYEDEVDILVDLSGHCEGGFTLEAAAYKPAPVQICGIGYFDTTGLSDFDYFLSDVYCDPAENDRLFSEKLLRLPHSHLCFTPSERFRDFERSYQVHNPIVFGSFNNFAKITDEMLLAWKEILGRVSGSRLLLKNVIPSKGPMERMKKRAISLGFQECQLDLRPATPDYLKDYMDVDIVLDTHPYPGGGTTCEALYMGVPVVNLRGTRHGARFGYSLLKNMGLEELSASSLAEYIDLAVGLAEDKETLEALHASLREMMKKSPVMNARQYACEVEQAYEMAWQEWMKS